MFIFGLRVGLHIDSIRVKFVYEGHRVKVKVTTAKNTKVLISAIENSPVKSSCSVKFLDMADRME